MSTGSPSSVRTPAPPAAASGVDMVSFAATTFVMGSDEDPAAREAPSHRVSLSPFGLATHVVTAGQFVPFMRDLAFDASTCDYIDPTFVLRLGTGFEVRPGCERFPMVQITFRGCAAFCNWLSTVEGLEPVYDLDTGTGDIRRTGYRLPTEAEWEYACRRAYPDPAVLPPRDTGEFNYRDAEDTVRAAWATAVGLGGFAYPPESPVPVGSLPPSTTGMFELLGNVREWCHDIYQHYTAEAQQDPVGAARGQFRAVRGGSYLDPGEQLRPHLRAAVHEDNKCMQYGFRLARSL